MRVLHAAGRLLAILAVLMLQACATAQTYSARPITAMVVDAETGEPLQGVNVVAHWVLHGRVTGVSAGDLELLETVTDKNGVFHFPGWQGKAPPMIGPAETRLSNNDPAIILFKSGYKPGGVGNYLQPERLRDDFHTWERYSDWDGKVIKLEKLKGNLEPYAFTVGGITTTLGRRIECPWKRMPRFFASLIKERQRLDNLKLRSTLPDLETMEQRFKSAGCGSARDFFAEYLK